jgi:cyclophilin family peptidyl-prolyl cis-trans isomerase
MSSPRSTRLLAALVVAFAILAAACGSDGSPDSDGSAEPDVAVTEESTPEPAAPTGPAPTTADHWHAPYGLFICDETGEGFIQPFTATDNPSGVFSLADGIIHIQPFSEEFSGPNATLGLFFEAMGLEISDDTISVPDGDAVAEGFDCNGEPTVLQVARWQLDDIEAGPEVFTEGLADISFANDLELYTIAYVPEGADIPLPPTIGNLATLTDIDPADRPALPDGFTVAVVDPPAPGAAITGDTPCPEPDAERTTVFEQAPPMCLEPGVAYDAVFTTSEGVIRVELDTENTPETVNNFVVLSQYGYYDGTALFRTDPSIDIIQGGSPTTNAPGDPGPGYTITDEGDFVLDEETGQLTGPYTYLPGDLVMARSQGPDSSGAQFFFAAGPNTSFLDSQGTYLNFGKTVEGLDVLETILGLHADDPASGLGGGPSRGVVITSVEIVER